MTCVNSLTPTKASTPLRGRATARACWPPTPRSTTGKLYAVDVAAAPPEPCSSRHREHREEDRPPPVGSRLDRVRVGTGKRGHNLEIVDPRGHPLTAVATENDQQIGMDWTEARSHCCDQCSQQ